MQAVAGALTGLAHYLYVKPGKSPGHLHRVSNVGVDKNTDAYRTEMCILVNILCNYTLCLYLIRVILYVVCSY